MIRGAPRSTLFPYTSLWRSTACFLSGIFGLALSLNPLAHGCRRIWRGEIWKYGFGGAVADLGLLISGSRRRPRRSQLRGQLRHDRSHQLAEGGGRALTSFVTVARARAF